MNGLKNQNEHLYQDQKTWSFKFVRMDGTIWIVVSPTNRNEGFCFKTGFNHQCVTFSFEDFFDFFPCGASKDIY